MVAFEFRADSIEETDRLAAALAEVLRDSPDGAVIALNGTLGAGKTRFVQAFAQASGVGPNVVVSPTFVLIQEYAGERAIYHFDCYRIADDDEFLELGPDEYFESGGFVFLEWADRVANCLPQEILQVDIEVTDATRRLFKIGGNGSYEEKIRKLTNNMA